MAHAWRNGLNYWLATHHGVVSARQFTTFGADRFTAYRLVERGELAVILPGVFRSLHWPQTPEQLMVAACVRHPYAAVGSLTAAKSWSFRQLPRFEKLHLVVPASMSPTIPGTVIHRTRQLPALDIVTRADGIRVTSPTRTLFDIADLVGGEVTATNLEMLINDGRGTFVTHASTLHRLAHPSRPGSRTMGEVIASRPAWRAAMQSHLEKVVLDEIERLGLPTPEVQYIVALPGGDRVRLDFAWPTSRVVLEVDHPYWHALFADSHRDKRRDRKMATLGWLTVRMTDLDVDAGLSETLADVGQILAARTLAA